MLLSRIPSIRDLSTCFSHDSNKQGPEDGGFYVQAIGVPQAISSYDEEEDAGTIGENPSYVPLVHAVAVSASQPQALPVLQAEAVNASQNDVSANEVDSDTTTAVERLLAAMDASSDKRQTVGEWIRDHPAHAKQLTPEQVGSVLSKVQFSLEQPSVAAELAVGLGSNLLCAHICAAVQATPYQQAEVVSVMAPFVHDPDQKGSVLGLIDWRFEREKVASCFPTL